MVVSIQMAWIGTLIGAVLSLPLGFFAAHNVSPRPVSVAIRVLLDAIRAFPELVLAVVIFVPIAGLGPFAGALAIGIHSVGTLGKLTAEAIESIDPGPVEAARASGRVRGSRSSAGACCRRCCRRSSRSGCTDSRSTSGRQRCWVSWARAASGRCSPRDIRFGRYSKAGMVIIVIVVATAAHRRRLGPRASARHRGPGWRPARAPPRSSPIPSSVLVESRLVRSAALRVLGLVHPRLTRG